MEFSCQKFGLDLLKTICNDNFDKNVIFSPLSIYMALGMTLYGTEGETSSEMMKTLYWNEENSNLFHQQLSDCIKTGNVDDSQHGTIKIANKLFLEVEYKLIDTYIKAMNELYNGGIEKMDFQNNHEQSRRDINLWIENQTSGKITNLLRNDHVNDLTKLILVNAIYFKGTWTDKFKVIGERNFHLLNGTTKPSEMMTNKTHYNYLTNSSLGFSAVKIPFKIMESNLYSLMIVLPNERCSLPQLEKNIFQQEWKSIFNVELFQYLNVHVTMPKFKIENSFSLREELHKLGMVKPFSTDADFSKMTNGRDLMISDVVHKAFIDIDENGVEAAAATAVIMMLGCSYVKPTEPIEFTCDHPFMFALVKQDSLPFFVGHFTHC